MRQTKKNRKFQRFDWMIFIPYVALCILGIIMIYSSNSYKLYMLNAFPGLTAVTQSIYFVIALFVIWFVYITKPNFWKNSSLIKTLFIISIVLLLAVLFIGPRINGAKGWLKLGPIQFQPLELFKVMIILMIARFAAHHKHLSFKNKFLLCFCIILGLFLILAQPDTGGFLICTLIILSMMACLGQSPAITVSGILIFIGLAFLGLFVFPHLPFIPEYMKSRFLVAYNPFSYALGAGHQLINSYYALYNGGWFGRGLGNSIEKRGFLPEAHTDFIFSIIVEELGMIVGLLVIFTSLFLIFRIFYIGIKSRDTFNTLICIGVGSMLFVQMFINLGGLVGLIPLTGVTLPFISLGGTSLVTFSFGIALVLNISAYEYDNRISQKSKKQMEVVK